MAICSISVGNNDIWPAIVYLSTFRARLPISLSTRPDQGNAYHSFSRNFSSSTSISKCFLKMLSGVIKSQECHYLRSSSVFIPVPFRVIKTIEIIVPVLIEILYIIVTGNIIWIFCVIRSGRFCCLIIAVLSRVFGRLMRLAIAGSGNYFIGTSRCMAGMLIAIQTPAHSGAVTSGWQTSDGRHIPCWWGIIRRFSGIPGTAGYSGNDDYDHYYDPKKAAASASGSAIIFAAATSSSTHICMIIVHWLSIHWNHLGKMCVRYFRHMNISAVPVFVSVRIIRQTTVQKYVQTSVCILYDSRKIVSF